jgi:hypothetical protein
MESSKLSSKRLRNLRSNTPNFEDARCLPEYQNFGTNVLTKDFGVVYALNENRESSGDALIV